MNDTVNLDDVQRLTRDDPSGILGVVEDFPKQVRVALEIGRSDISLPDASGVDSVVVLGMGGSGISGDVVGALAPLAGLKVPVLTVKGYQLPAYVGSNTLVFAVSYSGNTEETLDCVEQAHKAGARMVAVSSGGKLAQIAGERGVSLFEIPGNMQPRASLGYLFVPIVCSLERMGLISGLVEQLQETVELLEDRSREHGGASPTDANPTKRLASWVISRLCTAPRARSPWRRCASRRNSTRWPRYPRSTTLSPSSITTRRWAGRTSRRFAPVRTWWYFVSRVSTRGSPGVSI